MEFCNTENAIDCRGFDLDIATTENTENTKSTEETRLYYLFPCLPCFQWFSKNSYLTYFGINALDSAGDIRNLNIFLDIVFEHLINIH